MAEPLVTIIVRSFNEGWALRETLPAIRAQDYRNWELLVIDSGSTDGSVNLIQQARPDYFVQIRPDQYNPSRVMNLGMRLAGGEFGIFLNADATPQGTSWLGPLVSALQDSQTAAVFGKQIPRHDCRAVYAHDYERCFGSKRESVHWDHFFSMVSSGLRKDIWAKRGFLETMQYSEDDEYTRWCQAEDYRVVYVSESVVMHSHNYTPKQAYKRSFGEARALAAVWTGKPRDINWPRTVLLGWLNDMRRDWTYCARGPTARMAARSPHSMGTAPREIHRLSPRMEILSRWQRKIVSARFTLDGSDALEEQLARICEIVREGVEPIIPANKLEALVLGGGYGRGQGGVLKTEHADAPYNDLEFYVFLRGNRLWNQRVYDPTLRKLAERPSSETLHVEFKIESLERLRNGSVSMFTYDLVSGHRVISQYQASPESVPSRSGMQLYSEPDSGAPMAFVVRSAAFATKQPLFAGCEHHLNSRAIPINEATRLLFNRCTGLLLAKELLRKGDLTKEENDFIGRDLAKAQLALGDAVLTALGQYHWNCIERHERLKRLIEPDGLANLSVVRHHHALGVDFKLHPERVSKSKREFAVMHQEISELTRQVWLWLESRRLAQTFSTARDYAFSFDPKCPEVSRGRSFLLNLRTFGAGIVFDRMKFRYPRERLLNALPLLLWEDASIKDLNVRCYLQNQLRTTASDWSGLVAAYKAIWTHFG